MKATLRVPPLMRALRFRPKMLIPRVCSYTKHLAMINAPFFLASLSRPYIMKSLRYVTSVLAQR